MIEHVLNHPVGLAHVIFSALAILFGTTVIFNRKGTRRHRWLGRSYVIAMLGLNGTAFMTYELFDGFGLFHWMALVSLATVVIGYIPTWKKRPGWKVQHAYFMAGSYVGLIAALAAETFTRTPILPFFWAVAAASFAIIFIGVWLMLRLIPRLL